MKKTTITLAILLATLVVGSAQSIQDRTTKSDLVIEGKVIETQSYWNDDRTQIYTSNMIEVYKIFKGEKISERIEIITQGGTVNDAFRIAFHTLQLKTGMEGVFFCKKTNRPAKKREVQAYEALGEESGFIRFYGEPYNSVASDNITSYNSIDEIFDEIEVYSPLPTLIVKEVPKRAANQSRPKELPIYGDPQKSMAPKIITYTFENPEITLPNTIEFDVYAKVNEAANGLRFGEAEVSIKYNTDAFGSYMVANDRVEVTKGPVIQNSIYSMSTSDIDGETFKVETAGGCDVPASAFLLSTTPQRIFHFTLTVSDWSELASVNFEKFEMDGKSKYWEEGICIEFDDTEVDNPLHFESEVGIFYEFDNFAVTGTGTNRALEYDIMVWAETAGTEFYKGDIRVNYNPSAFGTNIASTTSLTITESDFLSNNNYAVSTTDDGSNTFKILVEGFDVNDLEFMPIDPVKLVHVKMKGLNCNFGAELSFDQPAMIGEQTFYDFGIPTAYVPVDAFDNYDQPACSATLPIIFDFSPKVVSAGIGDEIKIKGLNFGSKHKVIYRDANKTTESYDKTLPFDIESWKDTMIIAKVPSILENGGVAGTGLIGVQLVDTTKQTMSDDELEVRYAVINTLPNNDTIPYRISLIQKDENLGYKFTVDSMIVNQPGMIACIEMALNEWSCNTGVTWGFTDILNGQGNSNLNGKNNIFWGGSGTGTNLAVTYISGGTKGCVNGDGEQNYYMDEIDIEINGNISWDFDCGSDTAATGEYHFYSVLLHELGHGHCLDHALPEGKIMLAPISPGEIQQMAQEDIDGGLDVMGYGEDNLTAPCPEANDTGFPAGCVDAVEEYTSEAQPLFRVYPNPFNTQVTIEADSPTTPYSIRVIDNLGRLILKRDKLTGTKSTINIGDHLAPGMYFLQVQSTTVLANHLIIKN